MIIASCSHCGAIFQSRAFRIQGAINLTLSGNKETCPNCGKLADIADGVFDITAQAIRIVSAPDLTREKYARFLALLRQSQKRGVPPDQLEQEASAIDERFGEAVSLARSGPAWIILVLLILWLKSCTTDMQVTLDVNELFDQISNIPHVGDSTPTDTPENTREEDSNEDGRSAEPPEAI